MLSLEEAISRLVEIKKNGWVKTHRIGNTGIGKTLEDISGIKENNVAGPDSEEFELKSARKGSKSMTTLFTKSPLPKGVNSVILKKFGYPAPGNKEKILHTTIRPDSFNTLKGKPGFKIGIENKRVDIISQTKGSVGYWDEKILKERFEAKFPSLLYVKAECRGKGKDEEFLFNEAWTLSGGFDFKNFKGLLKQGVILTDIRIGQYPDGRPHDHGTGFRIFPDRFELCFINRKRIL